MLGKPFCRVHVQGCSHASPLSGSEPIYDPNRWNNPREIRETHNCFSYAMNVNDPSQANQCLNENEECEAPFHQPGSASGFDSFDSKHMKTCPNMVARILGDNPNIQMTRFEIRCPVNTSKIALVVDPDEDYHFLRQDSNMYWSHKPGARKVINIDARGHLIWDPRLANLNYKTHKSGDLDYTYFCAYMCVPRDKKIFLMPD